MLTLDRGHLVATGQAAAALDDGLRAADCPANRGTTAAADLAQFLRDQGDYWERSQAGRLGVVKRLLAKLVRPFFAPQVRYNLLVAEMMGRVEAALGELRQTVAGVGPEAVPRPPDSAADRVGPRPHRQ